MKELLIDEQYNTKEVGMKLQETMIVGMEAARTAP
jgi:hypothetical protein